jgi:hypothetical protein
MGQQTSEHQAAPRGLRFLFDLSEQFFQPVVLQDHVQILRALQQTVPDLVPDVDRNLGNVANSSCKRSRAP